MAETVKALAEPFWRSRVQFPALAVARGNQSVKYSLPCLMLPVNGCDLHIKARL